MLKTVVGSTVKNTVRGDGMYYNDSQETQQQQLTETWGSVSWPPHHHHHHCSHGYSEPTVGCFSSFRNHTKATLCHHMLASKCLLYQEAVCQFDFHTVDKAFISSHRHKTLSQHDTKLNLFTVHSYVFFIIKKALIQFSFCFRIVN